MAKVKIIYRHRIGKDGKAPILVSVSQKSKTCYYPTGLFAEPGQWVGAEGSWVSGKNARTINNNISAMLTQAQASLMKLDMLGKTNSMTAEQIRDEICPSSYESSKDRLLALMEAYRSNARSDGYKTIIGRTIKAVEAFDKEVKIGSVNVDWLTKFKTHLGEEGNKTNTISIHLRNIRAVVKKAIADEIIDRDPFIRFKIESCATEEMPMTNEEVRLIWNSELEEWQKEWIDMFKLCFYLIGINMVDLSRLTKIDKDGYIRYKRAKTGRDYCIKVEKEALDIINRYRGENHLLRCFDRYADYKQASKHMMHAVKCIGAKMIPNNSSMKNGKISGPMKRDVKNGPLADIQQYSTRRTWATMAYNDCGIGMDVISLCLGHSDGMGMSVTQRYVRPNQSRIDDANRKVLDKLAEICG